MVEACKWGMGGYAAAPDVGRQSPDTRHLTPDT